MIIKRIKIKDGLCFREEAFSANVNLVFSEKNSCGKTTFLRSMLYSLGYCIPNTKGLKFEKCTLEADIEINNRSFTLKRRNAIIEIIEDGESTIFALPEQTELFHSLLFSDKNRDFSSNLLGAFYIDQEKGWTLLNRGIIVGNIKFNIEEFLLWLDGVEITDQKLQLKRLKDELLRYKKLNNLKAHQIQIANQTENYNLIEGFEEKMAKIEYYKFQIGKTNADIRQVENIIKKNIDFTDHIESLSLTVISPKKEIFKISKENISTYSDNMDFLHKKKDLLYIEKIKIETTLNKFIADNNLSTDSVIDATPMLIESENLLDRLESQFLNININQTQISSAIRSIENQIREIKKDQNKSLYKIDSAIYKLYSIIRGYFEELNLMDLIIDKAKFVTTNDLKSYSGAILHKIVFAFKLAYIKMAEIKLGYKLPVIIDSPSGKEIDDTNVRTMMDILKRDFKDNQIIIASIKSYGFDSTSANIIEIKERLITQFMDNTPNKADS